MTRAALVAVAAVCALGAEEAKKPPREKPRAPVQESRKVKFPGYDPATGELLWELAAEKVTREPDSPRLRGTNVRIVVFHQGRTHVATAAEGSVDTANNSADLTGNVVIVFGDKEATRVEADSIAWSSKEGTAATDDPVRIVRPDIIIEGVGARLWLSDRRAKARGADRTNHLVIDRRVKTTILPAARKAFFPSAGDGPTATRQPTVITCAGPLTFYRSELTAVYRNNVRVAQGPKSLTCDMLTVCLRQVPGARTAKDEIGKVALESVTATGNVRLDDTRTIALGDAVIWNRREGVLRLIGRPAEVRWDNGDRLRAGLVERSQDGSRLLCGATPDFPGGVYLLANAADQHLDLSTAPDPALLAAGDIPNPHALAARLVRQGKASRPTPGSRVWHLLAPEGRALVAQAAAGPSVAPSLARAIVQAINDQVLTRGELYSEAHFRAVALPSRARELLAARANGLSPHQAILLNRLLLEAAFPDVVRGRGGE